MSKDKYHLIDRSKFKPCPKEKCSGTMHCDEDYDDYDEYGTGSMISMECDECFNNQKVLFLDDEQAEKIINMELVDFLCQQEMKLLNV